MKATQYNDTERSTFFMHSAQLYADHLNDRLKIINDPSLTEHDLKRILSFARAQDFGKVVAACRLAHLHAYLSSGFVVEGVISGFFRGEPACCVSCFLSPERALSPHREEENRIIRLCLDDRKAFELQPDPGYLIRPARADDIPQMIALFSAVFETYPSPVFSPDYLSSILNKRVLFRVAEEDGKIISIASADLDTANLNAEITDCATDPAQRGRGILQQLIHSLGSELEQAGYYTAYSLSRAIHPGINKALRRMGYHFGGTLIRNCNICGGYENMNIWSKQLQPVL